MSTQSGSAAGPAEAGEGEEGADASSWEEWDVSCSLFDNHMSSRWDSEIY